MAGGKLIVFSAPSGSGKTTIVQYLLKQEKLNLDFSISATSREPRKGEVHGQDYYFISLKQFKCIMTTLAVKFLLLFGFWQLALEACS